MLRSNKNGDIAHMSFKKIIVFVSEPEYAPAQQFIGLLGHSSDSFQVHVFQPSDVLCVPTTLEALEMKQELF
ncbi:hypothetical protein F7734_29835 [Scytonema sp. UIC 10036]|uniref:hypothetical protein n=1 Tax=Scytonema sp. UIC 10036 TaxID=2304196 RepID=UPI0012DA1B37|nr:hypothetical protein [Scytonema sp. UIC 10036]MUG96314.1 hypothetical protein [Scytonema sp. UIC 10036]